MGFRGITGSAVRECLGALRPEFKMETFIENLTDEMASVQRDMDKTGDEDDLIYYEGRQDSFLEVLYWLVPIVNEDTFNMLFGLVKLDKSDKDAA